MFPDDESVDFANPSLVQTPFSPLFQGYMSETGASLVDQKLGLDVVPKTKVKSATLFYKLDFEIGIFENERRERVF